MLRTRAQQLVAATVVISLIIAVTILLRNYLAVDPHAAREQLLEMIPAEATSVIFADFDQLRASPLLFALRDWAPHPPEDSEYAQFVRETGFSFERDLDRTVIAIANHGTATRLFAVADGRFDRRKIAAFATQNGTVLQQGKWQVLRWKAAGEEKSISITFLSDTRIAISDSENLAALLDAPHGSLFADWQERFRRLAGTPLFAVVHQDAALQAAVGGAAPLGLQSPQLAALLNQLQWISIAGTPQGESLQLVADGESPSQQTNTQLGEMLQGLLLLAQNGLNDPKLRQQMDPSEREAYLQIVKSAEIQKIDRGDWKSVRVVLSLSPKFLEVVREVPRVAPAPAEALGGKKPAGPAKRAKSK